MNIEVTVKNTTKAAFDMAFRLIALDVTKSKKGGGKEFRCNGYKLKDNELFLSCYSEKCTVFPYEYNLQQTIDFAFGWWENNQTPVDEEPDTDGSTDIAFEVTTERCGVGSEDWGMFASVKPIWFVYGK